MLVAHALCLVLDLCKVTQLQCGRVLVVCQHLDKFTGFVLFLGEQEFKLPDKPFFGKYTKKWEEQ